MEPVTMALLAGGGALAGGLGGWVIRGLNKTRGPTTQEVEILKAEIELLKKRNTQLNAAVSESQQQRRELETEAGKIANASATSSEYAKLREALKGDRASRKFHQPVLLVGPPLSGKSSLLWRWHTPWEPFTPKSTGEVKEAKVTLYYDDNWMTGPHKHDPTIQIPYSAHLILHVFDFPGEFKKQEKAGAKLVEATTNLREEAQRLTFPGAAQQDRLKRLGVVVICVLDCEAVVKFWEGNDGHREIMDAHVEYYNSQLFRRLREQCEAKLIDIECVVLAFNKFDLVRRHHPSMSDRDRLSACRKMFRQHGVLDFLTGTLNPDKMPHVPTVLNPSDAVSENQGASIVKSFAARALVDAVYGEREVITTPSLPPISPDGAAKGAGSWFTEFEL